MKLSDVLEPSAGKGDILEALQSGDGHPHRLKLDCLEIDSDLAALLTGTGFKPIGRDFLSFETHQRYDLIIMNPPFQTGDLHLLKALHLQGRGGQVVCLLNADTLRNPYTNTRKLLARKLEELGASIEYLTGSFAEAERRTDVDVALVHVAVPAATASSDILENKSGSLVAHTMPLFVL